MTYKSSSKDSSSIRSGCLLGKFEGFWEGTCSDGNYFKSISECQTFVG